VGARPALSVVLEVPRWRRNSFPGQKRALYLHPAPGNKKKGMNGRLLRIIEAL